MSRIDIFSFVDTTGNPVSNLWDLLYRSVMLTATFGPPFDPTTGLAKFFTSIHAIITLCLLVIVITFFGSISEEKLQTEKQNFLAEINPLLGKDPDSSPIL